MSTDAEVGKRPADSLSIDLQYVDPRPKDRQAEDRLLLNELDSQRREKQQTWQSTIDQALSAGHPEAIKADEPQTKPTLPDWSQSPIEVSRTPTQSTECRLTS